MTEEQFKKLLRTELAESQKILKNELVESQETLRDELAESQRVLRGELAESQRILRDELIEGQNTLRDGLVEQKTLIDELVEGQKILSEGLAKNYSHIEHIEYRLTQTDHHIESVRKELKADINRVYNLLDVDTKQREADEHERAAINHQLGRHEQWFGQISKHTGVKLIAD